MPESASQGGCLLRGVSAPWGCLLQGGVCSGGCVCSGGVSALGGVCSGGVCSGGGCWGVVSQHALRQTRPCEQNDKQVQKYYLGHNFVAAGNNVSFNSLKCSNYTHGIMTGR